MHDRAGSFCFRALSRRVWRVDCMGWGARLPSLWGAVSWVAEAVCWFFLDFPFITNRGSISTDKKTSRAVMGADGVPMGYGLRRLGRPLPFTP